MGGTIVAVRDHDDGSGIPWSHVRARMAISPSNFDPLNRTRSPHHMAAGAGVSGGNIDVIHLRTAIRSHDVDP